MWLAVSWSFWQPLDLRFVHSLLIVLTNASALKGREGTFWTGHPQGRVLGTWTLSSPSVAAAAGVAEAKTASDESHPLGVCPAQRASRACRLPAGCTQDLVARGGRPPPPACTEHLSWVPGRTEPQ